MKVLHLASCSIKSGAGRGIYWLHKAQCELGIDSTILTNIHGNRAEDSVISISMTSWQNIKFRLIHQLLRLPEKLYQKQKNIMFSTGFEGIDFTRHPSYLAADIVHLHWINGMVSMRTISKIDKPIVWTIRDMWPMTGGCHYSLNCDRYMVGCGKCPQLSSSRIGDLSKFIVKMKRAAFPKHLRAVGISNWISECAQKSQVFNGHSVQTISNNIDTEEFYPISKPLACEVLCLGTKKKIVLVGAQYLDDFYKGFDLFKQSLNYLRQENLHYLFFGNVLNLELDKLNIEYTNLGFLSDSVSLRLAYSAADVFVAPSIMEAFGKMLAEAMACGTPVVCFDATGPKDIVEHQQTGYKAQPFDANDLANGIHWVINQQNDIYEQLCVNARKRAIEKFDSKVIAKKYLDLYNDILQSLIRGNPIHT